MLTIDEPATDPTLISLETLRVAAGYSSDDDSHDDALAPLAARLTADIVAACNIAIGTSSTEAPPTLRSEGLIETFRRPRVGTLILSRRHNVVITSIVIDDEDPLDTDEFEVNQESGLLRRLDDGRYCGWSGDLVTVSYTAGFETIPADLDGAAGDLANIRLAEAARELGVKSTTVDVVGIESVSKDYWVGSLPGSSGGPVPDEIAARLRRYFNPALR